VLVRPLGDKPSLARLVGADPYEVAIRAQQVSEGLDSFDASARRGDEISW
jgi:hypothetical protein